MADATIAPILKRCKDCGFEKPRDGAHFSLDKRGHLQSALCRPCEMRKRQMWAHQNRDAINARTRVWWAKRRAERPKPEKPTTKVCPVCGKTFPRTPDHFYFHNGRLQRAECLACRKEKNRVWYRSNRDVALEKSAVRYRNADKDKLNEQARKRKAERRKTDHRWRLSCSVSALMRASLKRGAKRGRKWESLVGYGTDDLRRHLERQFRKGMTWENYGRRWQIDHIVPVASFRYTSTDDPAFVACWSLSNLRPLWKELNLRKSANREHLL